MTEVSTLASNLNTVWIVLCGFIIFFMQAGFAMLESGLVRSKNAVNVIMKNYIDVSLSSLGFFLVGYGIMYGVNGTGFFGTSYFFGQGLSAEGYTLVFFQMMFAATAATIVSGALAERIRYVPYVLAAIGISAFIYPVYGSWVWGGVEGALGWLGNLGFIDFAGSSVVHAAGGWCALAGVMILGPRVGRFTQGGGQTAKGVSSIPGHNLPVAALGAFILWFGFFAFNAGSTLEASGNLGLVVLNTQLSGAGGVLGTILLLILLGRPLMMGHTINGGLGGLVAICASANATSPLFALLIGLIAGVIVVLGTDLLESLKLDDAVGAVPVHAFAGTWGTLAVAFFGTNELFNLSQLLIQFYGALAVFLWAFPASWLLFKAVSLLSKLRVTVTEERRGLDYSEHYELGYPEFQDDLLHQGRGELSDLDLPAPSQLQRS